MSSAVSTPNDASAVFGDSARRTPPARLGVAVVHDLVTAIVNGEVAPGQTLPPEEKLAQHFGVSRTVVRESVKRVEEKGLITVAPGRGTTVQPTTSWNILDPVVLSVMLENDDALGVLDDVAVIRGSLEGEMSAETARRRSEEELALVQDALKAMEDSLHDPEGFPQADVDFHFLVMTLSGNQLASNITKILFQRARSSSRFIGNQSEDAHKKTLEEHRRVYEAIAAGDPAAAQAAMRAHIIDSWQRRRLPTQRKP
ncbi:FadR/GntR family transcriptional regulator [Microbacterium sp. QXD-8]|uniref:FadR/GntR family transcriptional regulator n=1 Tax=Microbacterium psychrotolerans TaxID=3068321 RepID=A0ABU0YZI3_9MICO|nr:FadR/GntR family transcriptional regulator [Microbacterium sp. QXD-8]MDQ7876661.1 FadR/GntR family transcriptional regulator [Microbacterium sp. QXD-8]